MSTSQSPSHAEQLENELRKLIGERPYKQIKDDLGVSTGRISQLLKTTDEAFIARLIADNGHTPATEKRTKLTELLLLAELVRVEQDKSSKWTDSSRKLARDTILGALRELAKPPCKNKERTLCDFPNSFYPLAVISGDKRENSKSRINEADFGAVSASPAEARWLLKLGLRREVEFYGDKIFMLEDHAQLQKRFGKMNLLVVGSPGSNHFTRRLHLADPPRGWLKRGAPIFRFNANQRILREIENYISGLRGKNEDELEKMQLDEATNLRVRLWLQRLFTGGIIDPTVPTDFIRAVNTSHSVDFGLLTFARNPFASAEDQDKYVCIIAAGFHMFGTAFSLKMLADKKELEQHPLGGVIRVSIPHNESDFGIRFDKSESSWDQQTAHSVQSLTNRLKEMHQQKPDDVHITPGEIEDCLELIQRL